MDESLMGPGTPNGYSTYLMLKKYEYVRPLNIVRPEGEARSTGKHTNNRYRKFQRRKKKNFQGYTLILTDKTGKELPNLPDLFADAKEGLPAAEGINLRAKLTTGEPMMAGQTYPIICSFFDKKIQPVNL